MGHSQKFYLGTEVMAMVTPTLGWDKRQFVINLAFIPIKSFVFGGLWTWGHSQKFYLGIGPRLWPWLLLR